MPVTAGKRETDMSQRGQYAYGGVGRYYWNMRDCAALEYLMGSRMLDAGCGEGLTLERIIARFPDGYVQGVDIDPLNVAICREHRLPVTQASVYDLPFRDSSFDSCILLEVIEHLENADRALAELVRVTRLGGRVIIVYPKDMMMYFARIACLKFREARFDPGHVNQWNARALGRLMSAHGLRRLAFRSLPRFWPFMFCFS